MSELLRREAWKKQITDMALQEDPFKLSPEEEAKCEADRLANPEKYIPRGGYLAITGIGENEPKIEMVSNEIIGKETRADVILLADASTQVLSIATIRSAKIILNLDDLCKKAMELGWTPPESDVWG